MSLQDRISELILGMNIREEAHDKLMEHKTSKWVALEPIFDWNTNTMTYYRECLNCEEMP